MENQGITLETKNDELVMKLLHYFITDKDYNPIVLHGAKNEIWLENLDNEYQIIRIVTDYIHNNEQFQFDLLKTKSILKKIKKKTVSMKMEMISFYLNLGDNVTLIKEKQKFEHISCIPVFDNSTVHLQSNQLVCEAFPDLVKQTTFKEKGVELFMRLTKDITAKSENDAKEAENTFRMKKPVVTMAIIALNVLVFILMYLLGNGSTDTATLLKFGANLGELVRRGQIYRLITSAFVHIGFVHLLCNCYSLYVIGPQLESFLGKWKFLLIYLLSALAGSLLSISFGSSLKISAGASGAIFGLLGSLLYFGYYYRVYLGSVLRSQLIPIILLNLFIGFMTPGIDNSSHIGGLVAGVFTTMALGIHHKTTTTDRINGWIISIIFFAFLIYLGFFKAAM